MPIGGHFENTLEPISEQEHSIKYILITRDIPVHNMQEILLCYCDIKNNKNEQTVSWLVLDLLSIL